MLGDHLIKAWSSTQASLALSSAEAKYYALVEAATRGLGLKHAMEELAYNVEIEAWTDSSAAKAFASRRGLGKMRHLEVRQLWLQAAVADGKLVLRKIDGKVNPADLMTKYLAHGEIERHIERMNVKTL